MNKMAVYMGSLNFKPGGILKIAIYLNFKDGDSAVHLNFKDGCIFEF
jgi:hypothetical protein